MPHQRSGNRTAVSENAPFIIVTTTSAKPDPAIRKQIRSHVMRGKNRKQRPPHDASQLGSWINGPVHLHPVGQRDVGPEAQVPRPLGNDLTRVNFAVEMQPCMIDLCAKWFTVIKQSIYPVEACVQPIDSHWLEYMTHDQAYLHSVLCSTQGFFDFLREARFGAKVIYYLNRTLQKLRENLADSELATSNSTISTVLTLAILSDVMNDPAAAKKHTQGLYILVSLRGGIFVFQDHPDLQAKVLRADLGVAISTGSKPLFFSEGFSWDPYLLPSKTKPSDNSKPTTIRPDNPPPNKTVTTNQPTPTPNNTLLLLLRTTSRTALANLGGVHDPRLLNILVDLQEFSFAANLAFQTGRKIPAKLYSETLVSVQYRLLALRDEDDATRQQHQHQQPLDPAEQKKPNHLEAEELSETGFGSGFGFDSESSSGVDGSSSNIIDMNMNITHPAYLLRLGMLAFTTTTFLQIKQLPMRYADLAGRMRGCVQALVRRDIHRGAEEEEESIMDPSLRWARGVVGLWFLFVARISVLGWPDDEGVLVAAAGRTMAALGLAESGWDEVRGVLRGVMWIDWVHSGDGKKFWARVRAERDVVQAEEWRPCLST
ncbi:hypothetical protein N658DRAFT_524308 [Parathielavia hyrcaniae]|uniref:Uncharacterized protein n=1 Tax=Parathielavia hyrcaniae TaxID=113614 RepID=A0AAN6Q5C3_9PEZI|nr:hypothetical protein N658DRAFT_524308 [Parathielavia hyrcaniae]